MNGHHASAKALVGLVLLIVLTSTASGVLQGSEPPAISQGAGWIALFDGKALDKWRGYKRPAEAGSRGGRGKGLLCGARNDGRDTHGARDIITKDTFDQFELTWEWRVAEGGNSGLKYFVLEDMDSAIRTAHQHLHGE